MYIISFLITFFISYFKMTEFLFTFKSSTFQTGVWFFSMYTFLGMIFVSVIQKIQTLLLYTIVIVSVSF